MDCVAEYSKTLRDQFGTFLAAFYNTTLCAEDSLQVFDYLTKFEKKADSPNVSQDYAFLIFL